MIQIEASLHRLVYDSRGFFKKTRYLHIIMAVLMFATGIAALVLSLGSSGTARVPYFFSAYVSGAWHIVFLVICQVCAHFMSEDVQRSSNACPWIQAYTLVSCFFVLFNVMGVVFTVVNGLCIQQQLCYYDKNVAENRAMAILLVLEHCISVLSSVLLAKRSHVIDNQLNEDVGIKLKIPLNFLHIRSRKRSATSVEQSEGSQADQTTSSDNTENREPDFTQIQVKGGHTLTTVEISAMSRKIHRRSKSQPNVLKHLNLKPIEGEVFSIYSDSETKVKEEARKKKRFIPSKGKKSNRVETTINIRAKAKITTKSRKATDSDISEDESFSSTARLSVERTKAKLRKFEKQLKNIKPLSQEDLVKDDCNDIFFVKPIKTDEHFDGQEAILKKQEKLQKEQEKLLEKQRQLFLVQQQKHTERSINVTPTPYEESPSPDADRRNQQAK